MPGRCSAGDGRTCEIRGDGEVRCAGSVAVGGSVLLLLLLEKTRRIWGWCLAAVDYGCSCVWLLCMYVDFGASNRGCD